MVLFCEYNNGILNVMTTEKYWSFQPITGTGIINNDPNPPFSQVQ
jgi:hypothetical protein